MKYPLEEAEKHIRSSIKEVLLDMDIKKDVKIETPNQKMGDFAYPCFQLSKIKKQPPDKIAEEILKKIKKPIEVIKIESKGGYVNFYLDKKKLISETIASVLEKKEKYGFLKKKDSKLIVEHTSANPNGPLHVGRARNPIIGDTINRIFKTAGYNVESQFYLDDMGKQVAILTWGVNHLKPEDIPEIKRAKSDYKMVGYYQLANKLMKEKNEVLDDISNIIKKSEEGDKKTIDLIHQAYKPVLDGMKESLNRINIIIDKYIPESKFVKDKSVDKVVEKLKKSNYCGEEKGAYYIDLKDFGIKGRNTKFYFLRKDGTTLYATRDIAYHIWKAKHADILINILGEDHKLESKQVQIALELLGINTIPKPIFYSFVSLPGGKMSTRRGRVVYLDDLIDEAVERAYQEVKKRRGSELSEEKMKDIAEKIGIGALRYNIIKVQPEKDFIFRWEDALNFEGNSAPFIQYSHARACSILSKKQDQIENNKTNTLTHQSEYKLCKKIAEYPIVIKQAAEDYKPHIVTSYLFDISSLFNQFYRDCPVLPEKEKNKRMSRLALVEATRIVIKNGLTLLGISAPKEM